MADGSQRPDIPWRWLTGLLLVTALVACSDRRELGSDGEADLPSSTPLRYAGPRAPGRDIIVITLDTTRRDRIGCYGDADASTPNLDALCARGVALGNATAVAPVTLPAHASLFTGLYPPRHGARYNGVRVLDEAHTTLAERLQRAGYQTAAFVSAFVLDDRFGLAQGFEHYDDAVTARGANAFSAGGNERDAADTVDAASAWLAAHRDRRPLLLWLHLFDPHAPYEPRGLDSGADDAARYAAEIAHADAQIGRLLDAPQLRGEDALIVVLADHGEALGEHGERTHGLFVYESTVAIPWILAMPGMSDGGAAAGALVSQVDFVPTVLDMLGLDPAPGLDGRSLLQPARAQEDAVYLESTLPYFDFGLAPLFAARAGVFKRIEAPRPELYRLDSDPGEAHNLLESGVPDAAADRLAVQLDSWLMEWPAPDEGPAPADAGELTERLRSLGYLSGSDVGMAGQDPKDAREAVALHQAAAEAASAGDLDAAIALLDRAEQDLPGLRSVLYLRARLKATRGDHAGAIADVQRVNELAPTADSLLLMAQLQILRGETADTALLLDQAARLEPGHGGIEIARGDLRLVAGDHEGARRHYAAARDMDGVRVGAAAAARIQRLDRALQLRR